MSEKDLEKLPGYQRFQRANASPVKVSPAVEEAIAAIPQTRKVPCQTCGLQIEFTVPDCAFCNDLHASVMIIYHPEPIVCTNCESVYTFELQPRTKPIVDLICVHKGEPRIVKVN